MSSPFASLTKSDPIPVPFDPPQTVIVRGLSGREFEQVQESHARGVALGRTRIWSQTFRSILEQGIVQATALSTALHDPLTGFDRFAVMRLGLLAWSYPQSIKPVEALGDAPAVDPLDDVSDEMVEFIATEIMRRTKPALFLTAEEREAAKKNG